MAAVKKESPKKKMKVMRETEIELPDAPKVEDGQIAMRMISDTGKVVDVIGIDGADCVMKARLLARENGFNFDAPREQRGHVASWERVA